MEMEFTGERVVPGKTPYVTVQEHIGRYVFASHLIEHNDFVLDIACGTGYGTSYLAQKASIVVGGDIDEQSVKLAHSLYSKDKVAFVTLDCTELPFCELCFDVIVSMETIEHLQDYESFLKQCQRVMRQHGMLICSTPSRYVYSPRGLAGQGYHVKEFTPKEFNDLLRKYWNHVTLYGQCYVSRGEPMVRLARERLSRIAGRCLSILPKGERAKELVKQHVMPGAIAPSWKEISSQMLDQRYVVLPFKNARPKFLIAIARDPLNRAGEAL